MNNLPFKQLIWYNKGKEIGINRMETKTLSKTNSLVNLANSILKFYGCETYHDSNLRIDELIKSSGKKKICLFLFDAFGEAILEKYKNVAPYMYSHRFMEIKSVFPTTTVAATTAITTGKYPIETGYIGWTQYFSKYDKLIQVFPSVNRCDKKDVIKPSIQSSILKTKYITDDINKKANKEIATMLMSFDYRSKLGVHSTNRKWAKAVDEAISTHDYVYAYNTNPDHLLHMHGIDSIFVKSVIKQINKIVKQLTEKHPDTLFLAISDHGMVPVKFINIDTIPGFSENLTKDAVCIEARFATFFVKDTKKFIELYHSTPILKDHFILLSKDEVLNNNLFGYSKNKNKIALDTIGDMFLISTDEYSLCDKYTTNAKFFKASHAGMSDNEINILLQAYNTK